MGEDNQDTTAGRDHRADRDHRATGPAQATDRPRTGVPDTSGAPVIDIVGHLRELRNAVLPALVVAVLIGVLVGVVRSFFPSVYERSATAHFTMPSATAGETFAKAAAAQFESLGSDTEVLAAVGRDVGMSPQTVRDAVSVKANLAPGVVDVAARAASPADAEKLVTSMITELDKASVQRTGSGTDADTAVGVNAKISELDARIRNAGTADSKVVTDLYAQRQALMSQQETTAGSVPLHLSLLSMQYSDGARATPNPIPEGAVAALVVFLLAAEGIVVFNSRGGRTVTPSWARHTGRRLGIDVDSGAVEDAGTVPIPTEIHVKRLRDAGRDVIVIDATGTEDAPGTGTGDTAASAPAAAGVTATAPTTGIGATPATDGAPHHRVDRAWWEDVDLARVDLAVVVVQESRTSKAEVLDCIDALAVAEVPTRLVVRESPDFSGPLAWLKI